MVKIKASASLAKTQNRHTIFGTFIGCLLLTIIWWLLSLTYLKNNEEKQIDELLKQVSIILEETETTFSNLSLANATYDICSPTHIKLMRNEVFNASHIKEVGYLKNNLVICNSMQGVIPQPYGFGNPDSVDEHNHQFWPKESIYPLVDDNVGFLLKEAPYIITLNPKLLRNEGIMERRLEIVHLDKNNSYHIAGTTGLYQQYQQENLSSKFMTKCTPNNTFCIASKLELHLTSPQNIFEYTTLIAFAIFGAIIGYYTVVYSYIWYYSPKSRIRRGFKNDNFYMLFQPVIQTSTREVIGCEVLARFCDEQGELYPDQFIPIIRELERTWQFTNNVISLGIKGMNSLTNIKENFGVNFNLFPHDVSTNAISAINVNKALQNNKLHITFEITEEEYISKTSSKSNLDVIKDNGYSLALDDFGTGYSNLEQFYALGFDTLKVDRSFVTNIENSATAYALAKHIIEFAHNFDLVVVAEGVENESQYEILNELKVEYCQGWLFGRPMTAEQLNELLGKASSTSNC